MRSAPFAFVLTGLASLALFVPARSQESYPEDLAKMMEKAQRFTQPGEHHELLKRFIGEWDTEFRLAMGGKKMPAEKGTATGEWLMEGRWLQMKSEGQAMGQALSAFSMLGYDNFKQSYVHTDVNSMDTAMRHSEGDVDPRTGALLMYGTLDEYLSGEHDKMVKYVWRFPDADTLVQEVHDLPIGEENTMVIEITYTRRK